MTDRQDVTVAFKGNWGFVDYAFCLNGEQPAKSFVLGLPQADQQKLVRLFLHMAAQGVIHNREKFKLVEEKIFEFKSFQLRIGCFQVGRIWYLTHGFKKKQDHWPTSELVRAQRIRQEHLSRNK